MLFIHLKVKVKHYGVDWVEVIIPMGTMLIRIQLLKKEFFSWKIKENKVLFNNTNYYILRPKRE